MDGFHSGPLREVEAESRAGARLKLLGFATLCLLFWVFAIGVFLFVEEEALAHSFDVFGVRFLCEFDGFLLPFECLFPVACFGVRCRKSVDGGGMFVGV